MNRLLILSMLFLSFTNIVMSQDKGLNAQWKEVSKLLEEGKTATANSLLEEIYQLASSSNDYDQMIKALVMQSQSNQYLEEDHIVNDIYRYVERFDSSKDPVTKGLLANIIAKRYNAYLQRNMYRLRNRSQIENRIEGDILTYSIPDLIHKTNEYYLLSIKDKIELKRIKSSQIQDILISNEQDLIEETDLYLILCIDLIRYFQVSRSLVTEPQNKFILNQKGLFGSIDEFLSIEFDTKTIENLGQVDHQEYSKKVITLYQEILKEYENNTGLTHQKINLLRLRFVKQHASISDLESHYVKAVELYLKAQKKQEEKDLVSNELIKAYMSQFNFNFPEMRWSESKKETLAKLLILIEVQKEAEQKEYRDTAIKAEDVIKRKQLNVQIEKITPSNKEALCYVEYQNITKLNSRIVEVSNEEIQELQKLVYEEKFSKLEKYPTVVEWSDVLPQGDDHMNHGIEIMIPPLKTSTYFLLSYDGANPSKSKVVVGTPLAVSDLAYNFESVNGSHQIVVVDRTSGKAIQNATVELFERKYDRRARTHAKNKIFEGVTNEKGICPTDVSDQVRRHNIRIKISKGADVLEEYDAYAYLSSTQTKRENTQFIWFTDRNIYRPGQTIHFKGIALNVDGEGMPTIVDKESFNLKFKDANGQDIEQLDLTTDEYGSISGTFIIPNGGLNGNFSFGVDRPWSYKYLTVEDYKRPKFQPVFNKSQNAYKLGDTVDISATAKTYAGINLGGAKFKYTIYRESYYPWYRKYYWCGFNPLPSSGKTFLNQKEGIVDNQGKIAISFPALADDNLSNLAYSPNYQFVVQLEVTDIDGETRSASKTIYLGTKEFMLDIEHPTHLPKGEEAEVVLKITNFDGESINKKGELIFSKIENTVDHFREKLWPYPEFHSLDKSSYGGLFPMDLYEIADHPFQQKEGELIEKVAFNTMNAKAIGLPKLSTGLYLVQVLIDGVPQEQASYIQIFDDVLTGSADLKLLGVEGEYANGDKISVKTYTSYKDANIFYRIYKQGELYKYDWTKNGRQISEIVNEDSYGNMKITAFYVKNNRHYTQEQIISIPWTHKDLELSYSSFRDNILPGADEEFTIKVSGSQSIKNQLTLAMYDASLDVFNKNTWNKFKYPSYRYYSHSSYFSFGLRKGGLLSRYDHINFNNYLSTFFPYLMSIENTPWLVSTSSGVSARGGLKRSKSAMVDGVAMGAPAPMMEAEMAEDTQYEKTNDAVSVYDEEVIEEKQEFKAPPIRKNLNETVFFYPSLETNEEGALTYSFKMNEAITEWKLMSFAHNQEMQFGYEERTILTKKDLLIQANMPRFLRAGDHTLFTAKVSNLSDAQLSGEARIEILNAITQEDITEQLSVDQARSFTIAKDGSDIAEWQLIIPDDFVMPVIIKVFAISGAHSDGEQNMLSVLTNRKLVTSTKSMMVRPNESKEFEFAHLIENFRNEHIVNQQFQLEFTTNPVWFAIKAMPYLNVRNNECTTSYADQLFGNGLASIIINEHPSIKDIFAQWANDPEALKSELAKNSELKEALLAETPWVRNAQSEEQQRRDIALLFDVNKLSNDFISTIAQLASRQSSNGGFCWTAGGRDNRYTTQYVLEQLLKLQRLTKEEDQTMKRMIDRGIKYLDQQVKEDYKRWNDMKSKHSMLPYNIVHYSYIHSMYDGNLFGDIGVAAKNHFSTAFKKHWLELSPYGQAMVGLAHLRSNKQDLSKLILESLEERAIRNPELGAYWKNNNSYYWYNLGIEQQALAIEFFEEAEGSTDLVNELKIWLLTKKQTTHWPTSKSTTAAIYALVHQDKSILNTASDIKIWLGDSLQEITNQEAGSGYFAINYGEDKLEESFGKIKVNNPNDHIIWGAAYWQYWDDLDKINAAEENPFNIKKEVFLNVETENGNKLKSIVDSDSLSQGDKLIVRVELRTDRDLDYVQMRDMRAAGLEPINTMSRNRYQDGLSYYESTRDRYTDFFFERIRRGTYVFEYELRVTHKGTFSNGITTAQCLYAPSFAGHSSGIKLRIH